MFVDGCYWHACPEHYVAAKSNALWWASKIARNVERDQDTMQQLSRAGWLVLRFWEHEDSAAVANKIAAAVTARRSET